METLDQNYSRFQVILVHLTRLKAAPCEQDCIHCFIHRLPAHFTPAVTILKAADDYPAFSKVISLLAKYPPPVSTPSAFQLGTGSNRYPPCIFCGRCNHPKWRCYQEYPEILQEQEARANQGRSKHNSKPNAKSVLKIVSPLVDSGASNHFTNNLGILTEVNKLHSAYTVATAGEEEITITHSGLLSIPLWKRTIFNPTLSASLD